MKAIDFLGRSLVVFAIALLANILVTLCWNYFVKGNAWVIDWETSLRFSLLFAIIIPLTQMRKK